MQTSVTNCGPPGSFSLNNDGKRKWSAHEEWLPRLKDILAQITGIRGEDGQKGVVKC